MVFREFRLNHNSRCIIFLNLHLLQRIIAILQKDKKTTTEYMMHMTLFKHGSYTIHERYILYGGKQNFQQHVCTYFTQHILYNTLTKLIVIIFVKRMCIMDVIFFFFF